MICWFFLVPARVPVLVSLLLSSLVPVLVSLLLSSFFPQEGVPFHHDLLVPLGSGWVSGACLPPSLFFGSGACLPSSLFFLFSGKGFCSIMICWFFLAPAGVPVLVSLLLSSLVPVLVSLLLSSFFPQERVLFHHGFPGSSSFWQGVWCLSPFFSLLSFLRKGFRSHHDLLVPPSCGWGSGACLPSSPFFSSGKGFAPIMICWFLPVPAGIPVLVSLLLSSFFSQERGSVPSWISWFLMLRAGVPVLVSLLLSSFFSQQECGRQLHEF